MSALRACLASENATRLKRSGTGSGRGRTSANSTCPVTMTVKKLACSFAMASDHTARRVCGGRRGTREDERGMKLRTFHQRSRNGLFSFGKRERFSRTAFLRSSSHRFLFRRDGFARRLLVSSRQVLVGEHRGDALEGDPLPRFARAQVIQRERAPRVGVAALFAFGQ